MFSEFGNIRRRPLVTYKRRPLYENKIIKPSYSSSSSASTETVKDVFDLPEEVCSQVEIRVASIQQKKTYKKKKSPPRTSREQESMIEQGKEQKKREHRQRMKPEIIENKKHIERKVPAHLSPIFTTNILNMAHSSSTHTINIRTINTLNNNRDGNIHGSNTHYSDTHGGDIYGSNTHNISTHNIHTDTISKHSISTHHINTHSISTHSSGTHSINTHPIHTYPLNTHPINAHPINTHSINTHSINTHSINANTIDTHTPIIINDTISNSLNTSSTYPSHSPSSLYIPHKQPLKRKLVSQLKSASGTISSSSFDMLSDEEDMCIPLPEKERSVTPELSYEARMELALDQMTREEDTLSQRPVYEPLNKVNNVRLTYAKRK
ncbi:hypothetical protein BDB01DRAFT_403381 [Pilobolus umbonatus]|nr:hypothetical protein BDB01DRAFT_403381 [Pilobolus umbonatus]